MQDLIIQDGTLVTSTGLYQADLGIRDGKIAEIGQGLSGGEVISAAGLLVLPGGVDPHVHIEMPIPLPLNNTNGSGTTALTRTSDTWESGSRAAAFGGTTTVIDFVEPSFPGQPLLEGFKDRNSLAAGKSAVDYAFHMTLCDAADATLAQIPQVIAAGMPSFKMYTTYEGFHLGDEALLAAFEAIAQAGGLAIVHAESDAIVGFATRRLRAKGRMALRNFPDSRPVVAEQEAVERVLNLAQAAGVRVYIVHVSTGAGAAAIARARASGQPVYGETCPQYLLLDESRIQTEDFSGAKFVCCPPLRTAADNQALWSALDAGELQTVGTDHCAFNFKGQKDMGSGAFTDIPSGLPGIELRLALMYTYGVAAGWLSLTEWVERCCTAPAKLFGLAPCKGDLVLGADADVVLFDPQVRSTVTHARLHEEVDYSPYEGLKLAGKVRSTLLRGQFLVRDGQWVGGNALGEYIAC